MKISIEILFLVRIFSSGGFRFDLIFFSFKKFALLSLAKAQSLPGNCLATENVLEAFTSTIATQLCILQADSSSQDDARSKCEAVGLTLFKTENHFSGLFSSGYNMTQIVISFAQTEFNNPEQYFYLEGKIGSLCKTLSNRYSATKTYYIAGDTCGNPAYPVCERINPTGILY
jgi:hypothetical protein